jgi:hypothetical protein
MLLKSEKLKDQSKLLDLSIKLPLMKKLMINLNHGLDKMKDQLLYHSMKEPSEKCSVKLNQDSVYSTKKDQMSYLMPSLKAPKPFKPQENN